MRVLLVGSNQDRARLRSQFAAAGVDVVGEFSTSSAARHADIDADAIIMAAVESDGDEPLAEPLTPRERGVLALVAERLFGSEARSLEADPPSLVIGVTHRVLR